MALTEPSCPARPRRKQKELEEQERERKREEKLRRREQKQRDRELRRSQKKLEKLQAEEQRKLQERIRLEERKLLLAQRNLQSLRLVAELLSRAKVPPPGTPRPREAPPTGTARPGRSTLGRLRPQGGTHIYGRPTHCGVAHAQGCLVQREDRPLGCPTLREALPTWPASL